MRWADQVADYLELRQALGHALADARRLLPHLAGFLADGRVEFLTVAKVLEWVTQPDAAPGSTVWVKRMCAARGFCRHMAGLDPHHQIPPLGLVQSGWTRPVPYIYTPEETHALVAAARSRKGRPLVAATVAAFTGLLASTGMRVGEAINLDLADFDRDRLVVTVRGAKFGKDRAVPIHATVAAEISAHLEEMAGAPRAPGVSTVFTGTRGKPLCYPSVRTAFRGVADAAGIGQGFWRRPTLTDLRHSFAVNTLARWHSQGLDVNAMMPVLSTYLGHADPASTYWYLQASPQLMAAVGSMAPDIAAAVRGGGGR
jgi:integrase